MNLAQAIQQSQLQTPIMQKPEPKTRTALEVAQRVFQLAASGGFPYKKNTPDGWARKWLSSPEFMLMEIDIHAAANLNVNAIASPHAPKNANRVQHYIHSSSVSLDPIVVDLNKRGVGRSYLGYAPEVIVLDGKHRKMAQLQQGRTKILAWVGCKAAKRLEKLKKVARIVDANAEDIYLPPVDGTKIASAYEVFASTVPAIKVNAGGPGSGRHSLGQRNDPFGPSRKEMHSYQHFDMDPKSHSFTCNHCKANSFSNIDDMYKHLQDKHPSVKIHASGLSPVIMKTRDVKAELDKLMDNRSSDEKIVRRVKALAEELKKRVNCCGSRSSGSYVRDASASDDSVPPDASDASTFVEPSDQVKWDGNRPNNYAPGTYPGYTDQFGSPPLMAPGAGVGPRVPNKGASRSELRRVDACGCGKAMKAKKKKVSKMYQEEDASVDAVAPPGREDQVKKLKKKFGKESAFKIAWSQYNKGKD